MEREDLKLYLKKISESGVMTQRFFDALVGGNNTVWHHVVAEAVTLDDGWVSTVDSALYSIERLVKNPRRFIKDDEIIVDVERAKKTNSKTIRHLTTHSENIRNVDDHGKVMPKKVLTTEANEELAIYENRFLYTLVQRLTSFVEQHYRDLSDRMHVWDMTDLGINSKFLYADTQFECSVKVNIKEPPADTTQLEKNKELLYQIASIRRRLRILRNTPFMNEMKGSKPVHPPIVKTNLLKMNVDYNNCYKLWLFISSYDFVGFSVDVKEKNLPVDEDYYDDLTTLAALSVQTLIANNAINRERYEALPFKEPKHKKYRLVTKFDYKPTVVGKYKRLNENSVNEYYFSRMHDVLTEATHYKNTVTDEKALRMSFERYFKAISKINTQLYNEVIGSQCDPDDKIKKTPLKRKQDDYKRQTRRYRRYKQLSRLMREELEKYLRAESRELIKLEKTKEALDKERGKIIKKRAAARRRQQRLEKIKAKEQLAEENAKLYEDGLRAKEAERLAAIEEQKRIKREEAKKRRELRQLDELKRKYEGETDTDGGWDE